jgi:hypothetical protein
MGNMAILTNGLEIGEMISDDECKLLQGLLKLYRSEAQPRFMQTFLEHWAWHGGSHSDDPVDLKDVAFHLVESYNQGTLNENIGGLMIRYGGPMADILRKLSEEQFDHLAKYLAVRRSGDWIATFVGVEVELFAEGKDRTPADVIKGLVNDLEEFDMSIETTERMLRKHPDLFREAIAKIPPKEPVAAVPVPAHPEDKELLERLAKAAGPARAKSERKFPISDESAKAFGELLTSHAAEKKPRAKARKAGKKAVAA